MLLSRKKTRVTSRKGNYKTVSNEILVESFLSEEGRNRVRLLVTMVKTKSHHQFAFFYLVGRTQSESQITEMSGKSSDVGLDNPALENGHKQHEVVL